MVRLPDTHRKLGNSAVHAELPAVSCICLTYARPALLEEAIFSFLQQDYPGVKELVVLNDFAEQTLRFEHPEVRIVNLPTRFRTVGEKMNAAAALCSHDLLFVWDDDDLYLPTRISFSVRNFDPEKGFFTPGMAWIWHDGEISPPTHNVFHSGSCWSRALFDAVRGYLPMGNGYDQEIEGRFEAAWPGSHARFPIRVDDIFYVYRWGGTGSYHMSAFGQNTPHQNMEQGSVAEYVANRVAAGEMPTGDVHLRPRWRDNYLARVRECLVGMMAAGPGASAL